MRWLGAAPGSPLGRVGRGEPGGGRTAPVGGPGAVAETPTLGQVLGAVAETPTLVSSARRGNDGIWFIGERKEMSSERGARERRRPRRPFWRVWERGLLSAVPQRRTTWGSRHGAGRPPGRVARPCLPPAGCRGDRVPSPASVLLWPPLQAPVSPAPHRLRDRQPCGVTAEGRAGRSRASRWSSAPSSGSEAQASRPHVPVTVLVCGHLP